MIINFNGGGDLSVQKSLPTVGKQGELSVTTDGEYQFIIDRGERFVVTTALNNPQKGSQNQFFKLIGNRNQSTYCVPFYYLVAQGYATKEDFEKGNDAALMAYNYGIATYDSTNKAGEVTYAFTIWTLNSGGTISGTYYQSKFHTASEWLNLGEFTVEGIPFAYTDSDAYNWSGVKINMRLAPQMSDEFFYFECHLEDPYFGTEAVCRLSRVYASNIGRLNNSNVFYNMSGIQYCYPDYKAEWRKAVMTVSPYTEEENMVLQSLGNGKGSQFVDFYENYTNGVKIAHPSIEEFVDMEKDSQTLYIVSDIKALYFGDALLCYNGDGFDVSRGQIDFDIDNLALTFKMRSNKDWTISADSFITLSQTSGTASEDWVEITASVERGIDFKSGVITISNGEIEKQISVTYPQYQVIKAQYDVASIYDESNPRTCNVFYYNLSANANDYISYVIYNNEYHVAENGMTLDSAFTGEVDFVLRDDAMIDGGNLWSVVYPLKSIELPSTMKIFWAQQMFTNAQNLSAVTLNDGLEIFGDYYLFAYTKITELRIPSSVSSWAAHQAFQGSSIQTLYIGTEDGGSSLTSAGEMPYAFYGCANLTTIYYYGPNLMDYDNLWEGFEVTGGTVHVASDYGVNTFQYLVDNLGWTIVKDLPARGGLEIKDIDAKGEKVTLDEGVYVSAYSGDLVFNSFDANTNMYFIKTEDWKEKDNYSALVTNDGREDSVFLLEIWGQVWGYNEDGSRLDPYEERTDYWYTYEYKNSIVAYKQTSEGVYFCGYGNCKLSDSVASFTTTTVETNPFIVVRNNKTGGDLTATVETSDGKRYIYKQPSL
jgi:hypothetical protein